MPARDLAAEYARERIVDQIDLMVADHGDGNVAWDSEDPADFGYLYDPDVLLVRSDDRARVDDVVGILNGTGDFAGDVTEVALPPSPSGQAAINLTRLLLPGRVDGDPRQVPLALEVLDDRQINTATENVATPDHWMHFALGGGTRLCPATEPQETGLHKPWPRVTGHPSRGDGVRVSVVDSGWHSPAALRPLTPWLGGVQGDPEPNGGPTLGPYAGHGTFIAGVVRCLAPGAEVFVERFISGAAVIRESDMVTQLRETLLREPHLINLSAGAFTRLQRPLVSFQVFWDDDLSKAANCLLVAAAGNDATSVPFWPAAFGWALGVGSLDRDGRVSSFSNFGASADVYALGRNLVNAYPDGTYVCRETPDKDDVRVFETGMARWSGTSFAAPVVAGLVAAELTAGRTVFDARDAVLGNAGTVTDPDGTDEPALNPPYT